MARTTQKRQSTEVNFATVADVLDSIPNDSPLNKIASNKVPTAIKAPVEKFAKMSFGVLFRLIKMYPEQDFWITVFNIKRVSQAKEG